MLFDCNNPCVICPPGLEGEQPGLNLTSEAVDEDPFIGRVYTAIQPPLGSVFFQLGCVSFCASTVSQEEANLCALRQNMICLSTNWPVSTPDPTSPTGEARGARPLYGNTPQSCTFTCPGGDPQTVTVPRNTFFNFNQATANAFAHSLACQRAQFLTICLSTLSRTVICNGVAASLGITALGEVGTCSFSVISGSLPAGLSLTQTGTDTVEITGTPTTTGEFTFVLGVVDDLGGSGTAAYQLNVLGITTASPLPDATQSVAYLQTLTANPSGVGTYTWAVTSGSLPPGLTMSPTSGTISGIPSTGNLGYAFGVTVTDPGSGAACSKNFNLTVNAPVVIGPDWSTIVWDTVTPQINGPGTMVATAVGPLVTYNGTADGGFGSDTGLALRGTMSYTGPAANCKMTITGWTGIGTFDIIIIWNGVNVRLNKNESDILGDPQVFNFTIPISTGQSIMVAGNGTFYYPFPSVIATGAGNSLIGTFTFENV